MHFLLITFLLSAFVNAEVVQVASGRNPLRTLTALFSMLKPTVFKAPTVSSGSATTPSAASSGSSARSAAPAASSGPPTVATTGGAGGGSGGEPPKPPQKPTAQDPAQITSAETDFRILLSNLISGRTHLSDANLALLQERYRALPEESRRSLYYFSVLIRDIARRPNQDSAGKKRCVTLFKALMETGTDPSARFIIAGAPALTIPQALVSVEQPAPELLEILEASLNAGAAHSTLFPADSGEFSGLTPLEALSSLQNPSVVDVSMFQALISAGARFSVRSARHIQRLVENTRQNPNIAEMLRIYQEVIRLEYGVVFAATEHPPRETRHKQELERSETASRTRLGQSQDDAAAKMLASFNQALAKAARAETARQQKRAAENKRQIDDLLALEVSGRPEITSLERSDRARLLATPEGAAIRADTERRINEAVEAKMAMAVAAAIQERLEHRRSQMAIHENTVRSTITKEQATDFNPLSDEFERRLQELKNARIKLIHASQRIGLSAIEAQLRERLRLQQLGARSLWPALPNKVSIAEPAIIEPATPPVAEKKYHLLEEAIAALNPQDRAEFLAGYAVSLDDDSPLDSEEASRPPESAPAARAHPLEFELSDRAFEHIMLRHGSELGQSQFLFLRGFSNPEELGRIISLALAKGIRGVQTAQAGDLRTIYTYTFPVQIGFVGTSSTSQLRVVLNEHNQVITAFPYRPIPNNMRIANSFTGRFTNLSELARAIDWIVTLQARDVQVQPSANGTVSYEYTFPVQIGVVQGHATRRMRVVVGTNGDILGAAPVREAH